MPSVDDYIETGESVTVSTLALDSDDPTDSHRKGEIACTSNRVVFSRDKYVADISLRSVNSIEYKPDAFNRQYVISGIIALGIAFLSFTIGPALFGNGSFLRLVGVISGMIGLGLIIVAAVMRRNTLEIHTPSKSYTFSSRTKKLENVAHAIRGHEP